MEKYSQRQFSERTGISRDTLMSWDKLGILSPIEKHGERKASYYSEEQIGLALKIPRRGQKTTSDADISLFDDERTNDGANDDLDNELDDERDVFDLLPALDELNDLDEPEPVDDVVRNAPVDAVDARHAFDDTPAGVNTSIAQNAPVDAHSDDTPATSNELVELMSGVIEVVVSDVPAEIITLDERANRIRSIQADVKAKVEAAVTRGAFEMGAELIEAKKQVPHGQWAQWLKVEFEWNIRTAQNLMAISERFANTKTFSHLNQSTLIKLLALPAGDEQNFIDAQAAAGNPIGEQSARQLQASIKAWKEKKTPKTAPHDDSSDKTAEPPANEPEAAQVFNVGDKVQGIVEVDDVSELDAPESPAATSSFQGNAMSEPPVEDFQLTPDEPPTIDELETLRGKIYSELNSIRAHVPTYDKYTLQRVHSALADLV